MGMSIVCVYMCVCGASRGGSLDFMETCTMCVSVDCDQTQHYLYGTYWYRTVLHVCVQSAGEEGDTAHDCVRAD